MKIYKLLHAYTYKHVKHPEGKRVKLKVREKLCSKAIIFRASSLRNDPVDILSRVFDVTRLAVNAVLGVYLESLL